MVMPFSRTAYDARLLLKLTLAVCILYASPTTAEERIKVGVIIPLSGQFATYGDLVRKSIEKESGSQLQFIFEDEACDPGKAVTAFKSISTMHKVNLFIGPACGSPQEAVAPLLKNSSAVALLNSSASRDLYAASGERMLSAQYAIEDESEFNAKQVFDAGYGKIAVVLFESQFSHAHERAFRRAYKGEILKTLSYSDPSGAGLKSIALTIKSLAPSALYVPDAAPFLSSFLTELHKIGVSLPIFSIYAFEMPAVLEAEGKYAEGVRYSYPRVGETDAISYFPALAARLLRESVSRCGADSNCVLLDLKSHNNFDKYGILSSSTGLELRTVRNGKFQNVPLAQ